MSDRPGHDADRCPDCGDPYHGENRTPCGVKSVPDAGTDRYRNALVNAPTPTEAQRGTCYSAWYYGERASALAKPAWDESTPALSMREVIEKHGLEPMNAEPDPSEVGHQRVDEEPVPEPGTDTLYECPRCGWRGRRPGRSRANQGNASAGLCAECAGPVTYAPGHPPMGTGDEGTTFTAPGPATTDNAPVKHEKTVAEELAACHDVTPDRYPASRRIEDYLRNIRHDLESVLSEVELLGLCAGGLAAKEASVGSAETPVPEYTHDEAFRLGEAIGRHPSEADVEAAARRIREIPWCTRAMATNADHIARAVFDLPEPPLSPESQAILDRVADNPSKDA